MVFSAKADRFLGLVGLAGFLVLLSMPAQIAAQGAAAGGNGAKTGRETGLPLPRYVSLKSNKVNVRRGPALNQSVMWVYRRAGLPVEITAEYGPWRQVRDSDGSVGWVYGRLLSGRRTALVAPWQAPVKRPSGDKANLVASNKAEKAPIPVFAKNSARAKIVAYLEPRVIANIASCALNWCRVSLNVGGRGSTIRGWIEQKLLWGVYPSERIK